MKIVFLAQEHPSLGPTGGIGSYLAIIAPALVDRHHDVHVVVCRGDSHSDLVERGVHLHLRPARSLPVMRRMRSLSITHKRVAAAASASAAMREIGDFDVIEAPEWMAQSLFFPAKHRTRLVVNLHTPIGLIARYGGRLGRDARMADRLEMRTVRRARAVTSPSSLLLNEIADRNGMTPNNASIIRLPIDDEAWGAEGVEEKWDEPMILYVGRLETRKGLDVLIRAMGLMPPRFKDVPVVALGGSSGRVEGVDYGTWVERLASESGVRFDHRSAVSRADLARWYAAARVLAVPSRFESFSMAMVEGMASGTPVVCTSRCGAAEIMTAEDGTVVPPDDPEALRDALIPYLEDEAMAGRAGEHARIQVRETCGAEVVAARRERVYEDCAS